MRGANEGGQCDGAEGYRCVLLVEIVDVVAHVVLSFFPHALRDGDLDVAILGKADRVYVLWDLCLLQVVCHKVDCRAHIIKEVVEERCKSLSHLEEG